MEAPVERGDLRSKIVLGLETGTNIVYSQAGRAGFEPAVEIYSPDNRLAGGPIRPLWHLPIFGC